MNGTTRPGPVAYEPAGYGRLLSLVLQGGTERFLVFDALGSADRLLAVNQSVTDQYLYEAFGKEVLKTGTTRNPFRWLGQIGYYTDNETAGVPVYVRARQYSPVHGRWLSVDPVTALALFHAYFAFDNSPLLLFDPSGLACKPPECEGGVCLEVKASKATVTVSNLKHGQDCNKFEIGNVTETAIQDALRDLLQGKEGFKKECGSGCNCADKKTYKNADIVKEYDITDYLVKRPLVSCTVSFHVKVDLKGASGFEGVCKATKAK